jgi:hypothetical protein
MRIRILLFTLMRFQIRILASKEWLKSLKECSNRLILCTVYILACHLRIDADPVCHFNPDPDAPYHFSADPDPPFQFDADPDPQHWLHGTYLVTALTVHFIPDIFIYPIPENM